MDEREVKLCWLNSDAEGDLHLPRYATEGSAGMDVEAAIKADIVIQPGEVALVPTGLAVVIPVGYELQIRPRSGLAMKYAVTIINSPGTIDSDYRGEIKIALINHGSNPFIVHRGDRIAQMVLAPVTRARLVLTQSLDRTSRGDGGFGHTGI